MSFMIVSYVYQLLESQGCIVVCLQLGYYVVFQLVKFCQLVLFVQVICDEVVDINIYIFEVFQVSCQVLMLFFVLVFLDLCFFLLQQFNCLLVQVSKIFIVMSVIENLLLGNVEFWYVIVCCYVLQGMNVLLDEIVIIVGVLEVFNFSLQVVIELGDWVVVENFCFYGVLQVLERLCLKVLLVVIDVREGIDLMVLEVVL